MWTVFLAYVPVVLLVSFATGSERAAIGGAVAWMALYAAAGLYAGYSRCPNCGERFSVGA